MLNFSNELSFQLIRPTFIPTPRLSSKTAIKVDVFGISGRCRDNKKEELFNQELHFPSIVAGER